GRAFAGAHYVSGAAGQPVGSTLPVLHVPALFARATSAPGVGATPNLPKPQKSERIPQAERIQRSILVVDDSMTIRTLLRNILRAGNYDVQVAADGKAGFDVLLNMRRCDLVITDLEMPRMNGVELCRAIRGSTRAQVPVMVVTSVGDPTEKRRALEAGADAYIIKSDFEQARFLDIVARLSGGTELIQ
ncbi:MAG TPA: response regulator, partial [Polyangium sp.]|nr:response regulator [Polyangium sp.]